MFSNEAPPDFEASSMPQRVANGIELSTARHGVEPVHPAGVHKPALVAALIDYLVVGEANVHIFAEWG